MNPIKIGFIEAATQFKDMMVIVNDVTSNNIMSIVATPIDSSDHSNANIYQYGVGLMDSNPGVYEFFNLRMPEVF